jgi:hypothetical protein
VQWFEPDASGRYTHGFYSLDERGVGSAATLHRQSHAGAAGRNSSTRSCRPCLVPGFDIWQGLTVEEEEAAAVAGLMAPAGQQTGADCGPPAAAQEEMKEVDVEARAAAEVVSASKGAQARRSKYKRRRVEDGVVAPAQDGLPESAPSTSQVALQHQPDAGQVSSQLTEQAESPLPVKTPQPRPAPQHTAGVASDDVDMDKLSYDGFVDEGGSSLSEWEGSSPVWLQCDLCHKWRVLPSWYKVRESLHSIWSQGIRGFYPD